MLPSPVLPKDCERAQLEALRRHRLHRSSREAPFDYIARLAADLFEVPTYSVPFFGEREQIFKGRVGFDRCETERDISFCVHAIVQDELVVVEATRADPRFRDNPLLVRKSITLFYAGGPIVTSG